MEEMLFIDGVINLFGEKVLGPRFTSLTRKPDPDPPQYSTVPTLHIQEQQCTVRTEPKKAAPDLLILSGLVVYCTIRQTPHILSERGVKNHAESPSPHFSVYEVCF